MTPPSAPKRTLPPQLPPPPIGVLLKRPAAEQMKTRQTRVVQRLVSLLVSFFAFVKKNKVVFLSKALPAQPLPTSLCRVRGPGSWAGGTGPVWGAVWALCAGLPQSRRGSAFENGVWLY